MPKPKKINFELIDRLVFSEPYSHLDKMRRFHGELQEAQIALAWCKALSPDKDGHLVLGKCVKVSDLHRELQDYDFIILLNQEVWMDEEFTQEMKSALVDHELCHAARAFDSEGDEMRDERGRAVWRTRKHDIEEFQEIVKRHGCYKKDLERFADELLKKRAAPLFEECAKEYGDPKSEASAPLASAVAMGEGTHQAKRKPRADRGTVN